ncbi:MAG: YraN family protein [Gammaproteobacteria bacterium]|nr:YraN family protein [Gammaproteobacteria bacterium]
MNEHSRAFGTGIETQTRRYLEQQGLIFVESNYSVRGGELDLVMRHGDSLVFVEVRYRKSERFGGALASVDVRKQARLRLAAAHYLQARKIRDTLPCRFDVVAVSPRGEALHYEWIRNAF